MIVDEDSPKTKTNCKSFLDKKVVKLNSRDLDLSKSLKNNLKGKLEISQNDTQLRAREILHNIIIQNLKDRDFSDTPLKTFAHDPVSKIHHHSDTQYLQNDSQELEKLKQYKRSSDFHLQRINATIPRSSGIQYKNYKSEKNCE